ncbi:MAG: hypothetical protein ACPHN2_11340 [Sinimarinibacterium flocculans]|jgi:hypothetical protein|uniref:Uncharacterized protein n=1 Tax=Sinimarinibacterium flocculans TaxID=985250 RepID=A0A318E3R2_9GAMM|nr:hypothetical protein [Sinimarinibacterium flocculans]MEC9362073.1 hypothetical protein [Pseudomonadota bacterium]PXV64871.1 hypothetical protein C8D93_11143 [Sinimarinibacterium flocculans]
MNWKVLLLGAVIVVAGLLLFAYVGDNDESLGDRASEAVEEVGDEIDDNT